MAKKRFYNVDIETAKVGDFGSSYAESDRIGFVSYDSPVMRQMATPPIIYPLGAYQQVAMNQPDSWIADGIVAHHFALNYVDVNRDKKAIPGIMVYDVEHILGTVDPPMEVWNGVDPSDDIFINKWTQIRVLDNMVKNYLAGDIKVVCVAIMELEAHIVNALRVLEVIRSLVQHSENYYLREESMLQALGFKMTAMEARQNFPAWFQFFNQNIVGLFNAVTWMRGIIPGEKRWASLYRDIYKDTDANTNYAQIYLLKPKYLWQLKYVWNPDTSVYSWTFEQKYYDINPSDPEMNTGVKAFTKYLTTIHDAIRSALYNEDTMQIRATFEAIIKRNASTAGDLNLGLMSAPSCEFTGPEPTLKFDFKLMIALHNATILNGLILDPPTVDADTGKMRQSVKAGDPSDALQMSYMNKVIDMPVLGCNSDDMMNATQWTVVTQKPRDMALGLNAYEIGTDAITGVRIYRINDTDPTAAMNYADNIPFYIAKREDIFVDEFSTQTKDTLRNYYNAYDYSVYKMILSQQWNLSPIWYYLKTKLENHGAADEHPVHFLEYVATQSEVLYLASYESLSAMHQQWLYAFWGYPGAVGQKAKDTPKFSPDVAPEHTLNSAT